MTIQKTMRFERWRRTGSLALIAVSIGALSACDDLLDVSLPHLLTDEALGPESTAETQVNSAIALFECGYTAFGLTALGAENTMQSIAGVYSGGHIYDDTPDDGECDTSDTDDDWYDQIIGTRALLTTAPERLNATGLGAGRGVYDRIQDEWDLGAAGERLSAISAIYVAASLAHVGEFLCEAAIDGSDFMTPTEVLNLAETWTGTALSHIGSFGDFAMPHGVAPSAQNMTLAIRSRIRWAKQDLAGAAADAATVLGSDPDFTAWVAREPGVTRRNKIFLNATSIGYSGMLGINTWWNPSLRRPNPATGQPWADPIPFTGYIFLGIMPDGRTLEAGNLPVVYAEELRDASEDPILLNNTAVADTRVLHIYKEINGPGKHELPDRYSSDAADVPYMTWEELTLIQADRDLESSNMAAAIGRVNALRTDKGLPTISGAYMATLTDGSNDFDEVRFMLLEERRREFFAEGARYWSTKIQNTDLLWFPREEGSTPFRNYGLDAAVRQRFGANEYEGNPFFLARGGEGAWGTGCTDLGSMFGKPGSQAPFVTG